MFYLNVIPFEIYFTTNKVQDQEELTLAPLGIQEDGEENNE